MPEWEERIDSGSHPDLRLEHEVRYLAAAPLVVCGDLWIDLGCGTGSGSSSATADFAGRAVLVDASEEALLEAAQRISTRDITTLVADLATDEGLEEVRKAVGSCQGGTVTCFEVIEHLGRFAPLIELLTLLADSHAFTVAISVPNDAFWSIENPYHQTVWGESAFAELTSLLPPGHVVAHQLALSGSSISRGPGRLEFAAELLSDQVPTHLIVAFGPNANMLGAPAEVRATNLDASRQWERQREADLAYFKALSRPS